MQHQTVPQTTVDLSHAGVDNILAALANAGLEVHYNETDGDTFLDIWLTDLDATTATILSWRENGEGWLLRTWESFSGDTDAQEPDRKWPIAAGSLADIARDVSAVLAEPEEPAEQTTQPTGTYRIAFDTVLGVEPLTIPAPATIEDITKGVRDAFEATDFSGITSVDVDLDGGQVTIADKDGPFEWASITYEESKPDYWLTLADDLRQAADRIATLAGTTTKPGSVTLNILGSVLSSDADVMVPLVDALAAAFDTTAAVSQEQREQHRADTQVGVVKVGFRTYVPQAEDPEKAALRAELEQLRAQLAGGAR